MLYKVAFLSLNCLKRAWDNHIRCSYHRNAAICLPMIRSDPWLLEKQAFGAFPYCPAYWSIATLGITGRAASVEAVCCTVKEGKKLDAMFFSGFCRRLWASTAAYMRSCSSHPSVSIYSIASGFWLKREHRWLWSDLKFCWGNSQTSLVMIVQKV